MEIFQELESSVRSYIRSFPVVFDKAVNDELWDDQGKRYIDFFAGAGTLNYGHNPPCVNEALIQYLQDNRIIHSLDKATVAKTGVSRNLSRQNLSAAQHELQNSVYRSHGDKHR